MMKNYNIVIVVSEFNEMVTNQLTDGAKRAFTENSNGKLSIITVPGAFEIPATVKKVAEKISPDAIVTLGAVIKGETKHFDFISQTSTDAIMKLAIDHKKPIGNGIITCLNMRQAKARKKKGREAAKAVLSILSQK